MIIVYTLIMEEYKHLSDKNGELIFITMWYFLLGLITALNMNTLTVCWFNRMKHY